MAAKMGDIAIVNQLLESGVSPNNLYGVQEFTDLMLNPVIKGHDILPPDVLKGELHYIWVNYQT